MTQLFIFNAGVLTPLPPCSCLLFSCLLGCVHGEQHSQQACICQILLSWTAPSLSAICLSFDPGQLETLPLTCCFKVPGTEDMLQAYGMIQSHLAFWIKSFSVLKTGSRAWDCAEQVWLQVTDLFVFDVNIYVAVMALISQACWLSQGECRQKAFQRKHFLPFLLP